MRTSASLPVGAALAFVGLVALVVVTTLALTDHVLGLLAMVVLWAGVGLVAIGGMLLVLAVSGLDRGQPADG